MVLTTSRHAAIINRIQASGEVSVQCLINEFEVSASTIRRDLDALNAEGRLRRVRGGAGAVEPDRIPFAQVTRQSEAEKHRIAVRAAQLVTDDDVVLLDIGTTTALLARQLRGRRITVITSSLAVLDALRDDDAVELVLLGGVLRRSYHSLVGLLTEQALRELRVDLLFLGTSGIRPGGEVLDSTMIEVPVKQAMIAASERVILLADRAKFPGKGLVQVCGPESVDTLITNHDSAAATLESYRRLNKEVLCV